METEKQKTLYVIDGYAALFRAFYAIRNPLPSPVTGEPTNAVRVFIQMLLKLYTTLSPDYVVVAWDAPGKTFRDDIFNQYVQQAQQVNLPTEEAPTILPELTTLPAGKVISSPSYKGTRQKTPDGLHEQTPRILELLDLFGIPVIGKSGLEADDIIATLTHQILANPSLADVRVRIATTDKDMEQLIGERVTLFDIHTGAELDAAALWDKRGITPSQVVDFLTLTGDAVDNIPGVAGIGSKTAAKLLQQYDSLEGILEGVTDPSTNNKQISQRLRESLERARPLLPLSRRLITLEKKADLPFVLEDARLKPISAPDMEKFCDDLGFARFKEQCLAL